VDFTTGDESRRTDLPEWCQWSWFSARWSSWTRITTLQSKGKYLSLHSIGQITWSWVALFTFASPVPTNWPSALEQQAALSKRKWLKRSESVQTNQTIVISGWKEDPSDTNQMSPENTITHFGTVQPERFQKSSISPIKQVQRCVGESESSRWPWAWLQHIITDHTDHLRMKSWLGRQVRILGQGSKSERWPHKIWSSHELLKCRLFELLWINYASCAGSSGGRAWCA
jgi:hypothetical protein